MKIKKFNDMKVNEDIDVTDPIYLLEAAQHNLLSVINENVLHDISKEDMGAKLSAIHNQLNRALNKLK